MRVFYGSTKRRSVKQRLPTHSKEAETSQKFSLSEISVQEFELIFSRIMLLGFTNKF